MRHRTFVIITELDTQPDTQYTSLVDAETLDQAVKAVLADRGSRHTAVAASEPAGRDGGGSILYGTAIARLVPPDTEWKTSGYMKLKGSMS